MLKKRKKSENPKKNKNKIIIKARTRAMKLSGEKKKYKLNFHDALKSKL